VLFSEPKIPQCNAARWLRSGSATGFSALQRAENSSIYTSLKNVSIDRTFQCSSASRKFLNNRPAEMDSGDSIVSVLFSEPKIPQYRKEWVWLPSSHTGFSALQRAENSSIVLPLTFTARLRRCFSALQRAENSSIRRRTSSAARCARVSVLFSEPKIPQWFWYVQRQGQTTVAGFQCSSASRKFLNYSEYCHRSSSS